MQVGLLMVFQNFEDQVSDREVWQRDVFISQASPNRSGSMP